MISTMARLGLLALLLTVFCLTTVMETDLAATNPFDPAPGSPVSVGANNTGFVAVGDLNGDGKPDLAVVSTSGNSVSVLLGTGGGAFGPPTAYAVGGGPLEVAIGDLNGDAKPDLVVTNETDGTISVLLNTGAGAFSAAQTFTIGSGTSPEGVTIADVNGDGRNDIIVTDRTTNTITIFLNSALGFTVPTTLAAGKGPAFVKAADVNGDGKLDLIVANNTDNSISIFIGNGNGTFQPRTDILLNTSTLPCTDPDSLVVADLNGDSKPDIAAVCTDTGTAAILLGNGNGTFAAPVIISTGPVSAGESIAAADFDNKNGLDLVIADSKNNVANFLLNTGNGTFSPSIACQLVGSVPFTVAVADFNNDTKPDIAVANTGDGTVSILLNNGSIAPGSGTGPGCPTVINNGNFTIQISPTSVTTKAGTLVTYTVTVIPGAGFAGSVALTCTSAAPNSGCSLSPTAVNLQNGVSATSTLSVATNFFTSGGRAGLEPTQEPRPQARPLYAMLSFGGLGMAGLVLSTRRAHTRRKRLAGAIIATLGIVLLLITSQGCSSGKGGFPDQSHNTPPGTYGLTVTGSVTVGKTVQSSSGSASIVVQ